MREQERKTHKMGIARRHLLLGLGLVMCLGTTVYFRLWVIDYKISSADSDILRRQFDLAHREAVDESAEWRLRFDQERERSANCVKELTKVKESLDKNKKDTPAVDERIERLQKENIELLARLKLLKRDLEATKLKCMAQ
ncbi:hypothetical protein RND81_04G061300 [Saponaria officinalis]|uniref:Transmembrane protein n=1 Tax=Saponaria officinalis TaxID=3572 RepID=A0AAW1LJE3_SAPOF